MIGDPVIVGGHVIDPQAIAAEAQHHPAPDAQAAWDAAAEALAIRQLLLGEAERLGLGAGEAVDGEGRQLAEADARIEALLAEVIRVPEADEAACRRYFDTHKARFAGAETCEAWHILFAAGEEDAMAQGLALSDAREVMRVLAAEPERFAELARARSACPSAGEGGYLGWIAPGQTVAPFEQALFALGEGETAPAPVRTRFGWHILRAGGRIAPKQRAFEEVAPRIGAYLEEASYRRAVAQYIALLAGQHGVSGVQLTSVEGPLVQ